MRFISANAGYALEHDSEGAKLTIIDATGKKVSGSVSAGTTQASVAGLVVTLYASSDSSYGTPLYYGATDENGAYLVDNVADGSYIAVVAASQGNYDRAVSGTITVSGADVTTGADIRLAIEAGGSGDSGDSGDSGRSNQAVVEVNGKNQSAGTIKTETSNGITTTTVSVTSKDIKSRLNSAEDGSEVTIPISTGCDKAVGRLDGQAVKDMETKAATLTIQTEAASYTLPAAEINIGAVSEAFGEDVSLADINVDIAISQPDDAMVEVVESAAADGNLEIVVPAMDFSVTCTCNGKTVEIENFNSYVARTIRIPDGVDPGKITTAVVVDGDGTVRHVPTEITVIDGVYYAKIKSLTNSTYTVVWHPVEFPDAEGNWAKAAINDIGSRMIVFGDENGNYNPGHDMTRAEFAVIIVRALGLAPGNGESNFSDVSKSAWYCGYVETAAAYRIINGYSDGTFGPNDLITREQAMVMITRAMKLAGLEAGLTDGEVYSLPGAYRDGAEISDYSMESIAACLKAGIISGKSVDTLAPKDYITRAEVAVIVQRLLQKSELI